MRLRRILRSLVMRIMGHKNDCCDNITWRCKNCPLNLSEEDSRRLKYSADSGYITLKEIKPEVVILDRLKKFKED